MGEQCSLLDMRWRPSIFLQLFLINWSCSRKNPSYPSINVSLLSHSMAITAAVVLSRVSIRIWGRFQGPLRIKDVLPVLPRQISWPVLNNFHSAVDLLPSFIGSVTPDNTSIEWEGACFSGNQARLEFTEGDRDKPNLGGGVLYLKVRSLSRFELLNAFSDFDWFCLQLS